MSNLFMFKLTIYLETKAIAEKLRFIQFLNIVSKFKTKRIKKVQLSFYRKPSVSENSWKVGLHLVESIELT